MNNRKQTAGRKRVAQSLDVRYNRTTPCRYKGLVATNPLRNIEGTKTWIVRNAVKNNIPRLGGSDLRKPQQR